MRMQTYVILIFCMTVVCSLLGFQNGLAGLWSQQGGQLTTQGIITNILDKIFSANNVAFNLLAVLVTVGAILAGFSAMFVIPAMILVAVLNYYVFPTSFFIDSSCTVLTGTCAPNEFSMILLVFFNILTILAIVDFIRGSS